MRVLFSLPLLILPTLFFSATNVFSAADVAAKPQLLFSDITTGPKTGLSDGLGSGAIVTVWGTNLGAAQESSKVYIGAVGDWHEAAHVYYWENADPENGSSGPADLYKYHKMQEVAFSIPASAPSGGVKIKVQVGGVDSNELNFSIVEGRIFYVTTSGSDLTGDGSWSNPWRTFCHITPSSKFLRPGDIVYGGDGLDDTCTGGAIGLDVGWFGGGTESHPVTFTSYPGATVYVHGSSYGVRNRDSSPYVNITKLKVSGNGIGIFTFRGGRIVGNEITDNPGGCADGSAGAICGNNLGGNMNLENNKIFGNYIHDWGCEATGKLEHVVYLSNRGGLSGARSFELGWNVLKDNLAEHGLQIYDEGACGDFVGTMTIHDNVIIEQRGVGIGIATGGTTPKCFTMPVQIYNNFLAGVGRGPVLPDGAVWTVGISFSGSNNMSDIQAYNNTIYSYGDSSVDPSYQVGKASLYVPGDFGGSYEWKNNIVYDTENTNYVIANTKAPRSSSNNVWYSGGDSQPMSPPNWDISPIASDPGFVDPVNNDFRLQSTSPCKDFGTASVSAVVKADINGTARPQGDNYDIGAYEYDEGGASQFLDGENPTVTISSPTTGTRYQAELGTISLEGTASDNVAVQSVTWAQNGGQPQDATGTNNWSISSVTLVDGTNNIVVTATDTSGNTASATIVIDYAAPPTGTSQTVTLGDVPGAGYTGVVQDTYINLNNSVNSSSAQLNTYTWPINQPANAIILRWNLSDIPTGAAIEEATLYLYAIESEGDAQYAISAHRAINHNPAIAAATGYTYDGSHGWTPNSVCYNNIPLAQADIAAAENTQVLDSTLGYKTWNVTQMVRDWVAQPSTNFGMLLNSDSSATQGSYRYFASNEASDPNRRPKLVVTYSVDTSGLPPRDVTGAHVANINGASLTLAWTNPSSRDAGGTLIAENQDFSGVMIRYNTGAGASAPASHTDGMLFGDEPGLLDEEDSHTASVGPGVHHFAFFTHDDKGHYSATTTLTVDLSAPVITSFIALPASPENPLQGVNISVQASGAAGATLRYSIDFGDTTAPASNSTVTHSYSAAGTYTAIATVTDDRGLSTSKSIQIVVRDLPPNPPKSVSVGE